MDIQHLVDRLEGLIDEGRHIFGTRFTMIDEERALEIIDQMRISIPEEIEKATRIIAQRDRVLAEANEEAARIIQQARRKGSELIERDTTVQSAQARANMIIEQARQEAAKITEEADAYVVAVLGKLEQELLKNLNVVRNGISEVQSKPPLTASASSAPPSTHLPNTIEPELLDVESKPRIYNKSDKK